MPLRDINYGEDYRSGHDNILDDFFRPSLREATTYWRAVGYFCSSALESFGAPLDEFIRNGGHIKLITSVELTEEDTKAIEDGLNKKEICERRIDQIVEKEFSGAIGDGVLKLAALLRINRLEVQIAVPKTGRGIYHEKVGVFFDASDYVAFSGSTNESRNALENNYECLDVYPSWEAPSRAQRKRTHFEELWTNNDKGADVYKFPDALAKKLIRFCDEATAKGRTQAPDRKWRHQDEAVEEFLRAERGVLNMATGTGKTHTALKIVTSLFRSNKIDTVIVATDGTDLLNQWYRNVLGIRKDIGDRDLRVYRHYYDAAQTQDFILAPKNAALLVSRKPLASALRQISDEVARRTLLIHDEVHGLGSPGNRERLEGLSDSIRFRLGLSATPEREYDQEGNEFIEAHIGPVLKTFELKDAIERGILAPFNYFPLTYELTTDDRERLRNIYRRKAAKAAAGEPMSEEQLWIELAQVYKTSRAKLPLFADFIRTRPHLLERCIIFVETQEYGSEVLDIVHRYRSDFHTYFSNENCTTLLRFARGDLECLVTCHRLSEGIDIQSLNNVILFSASRARLETIQRIGRCLRTDPSNPGKVANIVDFIRHTNGNDDPNADDERCAWLTELAAIRPKE